MLKISRREALTISAGTLLATAVNVKNANAASLLSRGTVKKLKGTLAHPFNAGKWAQSADDSTMGRDASFFDLEDQISSFFGTATGRYLADILIYPRTAAPGWNTANRPLYDQFQSIYSKGWAELDATLVDGRRMVLRNYDSYRAAVFLGLEGNLDAAALTFDYSPPGGVTNRVLGKRVRAKTLWPFSVVLFHKQRIVHPNIANALRASIRQLPLVSVRSEAKIMTQNGRIRIKVFSRRV